MKNSKEFQKHLNNANAGDLDSQIHIAFAYKEGKGVDINLNESFKWYKIVKW